MVLINKLEINLKYGQQHRFTFFRCVFAAFMFITTETIMIYSLEKNEEHIFEIFWILYTIPLLICSLQFQQIISYLCLVQHRYRSINEFIKYKCVSKSVSMNSKSLISAQEFHPKKIFPNRIKNGSNTSLMYKMKNLRYAQRLLFETILMIRKLFYWSLLFNIANNFQKSITSAHFILMTTI